MSTEGKMSTFRLLNPTPHLPPPHTEQWQLRTICLVCTTSTPKPHIWQCLLLLPLYFPPMSSRMTEPTCHEIADFPLTTQTQHTVTATNCSLCHTRWGTGRAGPSNNLRSPTLDTAPVLSLAWLQPSLTKVLNNLCPTSPWINTRGRIYSKGFISAVTQCPPTQKHSEFLRQHFLLHTGDTILFGCSHVTPNSVVKFCPISQLTGRKEEEYTDTGYMDTCSVSASRHFSCY